ncbi:hypothetical protein HYW74_02580 [Candidatus Pacearchaeota archaeon]|nr:hypothetical protein [Candidatus Pacearchaeota archaeon]
MTLETNLPKYLEYKEYINNYETIIALTTRATNLMLLKPQDENNTAENGVFLVIGE